MSPRKQRISKGTFWQQNVPRHPTRKRDNETPARMAMHVQIATIRSRGFTITELLVVVIIIGLLAVVATPALRSSDPAKLDLAATRLAEALRFARSEAMRTGQVHSVQVRHNDEAFAAEKTDLSAEPAGAEFILRHPVTKQLYELDLDTWPPVAGVLIINPLKAFHYQGLGRRQRLMFDAQGLPIYIKPIAGETYHLTAGEIRLRVGDRQVGVTVEPYTGRVTIQ